MCQGSRRVSEDSVAICERGEGQKATESELYNFCFSSNRLFERRMRWAGHVARMEEGRGVHKVLVGKPEGKRPLGETKT